jgi:hypothetical protein
MADENRMTKGDYYSSGRFPVGTDGAHKCPVCEQYVFEEARSYDICEVCGWEDDNVQENDPDYRGGANELSLNQYRDEWEQKQALAKAQ